MKNNKSITAVLLVTIMLFACKKTTTTTPTGTGTTGTTLSLQPSGVDAYYAVVASGAPTSNYGPPYPEYSALSGTSGGNPILLRGLIKFDLSSIPAGKTITSATLSLYSGNDPVNGTNGMNGTADASYLQRITSTWSESTVTWNTQPATTTSNQVSLAQSTSANQDYTTIDVKNLVQDMVNNASTSFGFMLKLQVESGYNSMQFASSGYTDATKHPKLVVVYQ